MSYPKQLLRRFADAHSLLGFGVVNLATLEYGYATSIHVHISGSVQLGLQPFSGKGEAMTADAEQCITMADWLDNNKGLAHLIPVDHQQLYALSSLKNHLLPVLPPNHKIGEWVQPQLDGMRSAPITTVNMFLNGCVYYGGNFNPKRPDDPHVAFPATMLAKVPEKETIPISERLTGGPSRPVNKPTAPTTQS